MIHRNSLTTAVATLALVLASAAFTSGARADDPLNGSPQSSIIEQSARSAVVADPHETPLAVATAKARAQASPLAASVDAGGLSRDLLGEHGLQDDTARMIYRPGADLGIGGQ